MTVGVSMRTRIRILGLLAVGVVLPLLACAGRALPPPPEGDPMEQDTYVIGAGDVLQISVWDNPQVSNTVPVRPDGRISLALLDDVQAAGLTPLELKEVVGQQLTEFIGNADVTVIVRAMNSKRAYLIGEVPRQGAIQLTQDTRILDALASAGGFTNFADKSDIRILRKTGKGDLDEYTFDYDAYIAGKAPGTNILLQPGDTIVVSD